MFHESQYAAAYWVAWLFVAGVVGVMWLLRWFVPGVPRWMPLLFTVVIPTAMLIMVQTVDVDAHAIRIRMFPFMTRVIHLADVRSAETRTYRAVDEYGGWGIRDGRGGTAYTSRGDRGVQLVLDSGERVLIGSQRSDELARAIADGRRHP